MGGAEIAGRVGSASTAADIGSVAQHHERREVVIQRPQSPVHPRAKRGMVPVEDVMPRVEFVLCGVVVVGAPDRTDDGEAVGLGADVRPPVGHLNATLAARCVANLQRVHRRHQVAGRACEVAHIPPVVGRLHNRVGVGSLVDGLARMLVQGWLGVEALDVAHPAQHEQPDHIAGPGREGRHPRGDPTRFVTGPHAIAIQHCPQCQATKPQPGVGQESPAASPPALTGG